jgi:phage tail-like protein
LDMTRSDPYRAFRFRIEIDNTRLGGFQTVSGLERETRIEPYREGGVNHFERQLITLTSYPALTLKRGLVDTMLWDWHQDVIDGLVARRTISVVLLDERGEEAWRWICVDAFPTKWTGAELDATNNAIATESIDFAHHGITRQ